MESITKENGEAINTEVYSGWRYLLLSADIKKSSKQRKGDQKMQGTVKFFHENRGWGFITSEDKDFFVHYSQIKMTGRKILSSDDIVNFDISAPDENGRVQAVNVRPILTRQMVKDALADENLHTKIINTPKETKYQVVDENDVIQAGENGMTFLEVAAFTGFDTEDLSA